MQSVDQHEEDDVIASINIVPFVDIVLVLLIIFMVTSVAIVKGAITVELPKAAAAGQAVDTTLNIVFTLDRELILDGAAVDRETLGRSVRTQAQIDPELQVVISADTGIPYGEVVGVIDLVKFSGAKSFALNIERETLADASSAPRK